MFVADGLGRGYAAGLGAGRGFHLVAPVGDVLLGERGQWDVAQGGLDVVFEIPTVDVERVLLDSS